jgi:hypothetical protein
MNLPSFKLTLSHIADGQSSGCPLILFMPQPSISGQGKGMESQPQWFLTSVFIYAMSYDTWRATNLSSLPLKANRIARKWRRISSQYHALQLNLDIPDTKNLYGRDRNKSVIPSSGTLVTTLARVEYRGWLG